MHPSQRDALSPEAIRLIDAIHSSGSMAAAARLLGVVPSALTYRARQLLGPIRPRASFVFLPV